MINKSNFYKALKEGGSFLQIDLYYEDADQLIVENDKIPLSEYINKYLF
jgi:hypothetical protein